MVSRSIVVIPYFLELELYLIRREPELELVELDQLLELAPSLESVPLLELAPGIQCLGHSNWTNCSPLSPFCPELFPTFPPSYWGAHSYYPRGLIMGKGKISQLPIWMRQRDFSAWGIQTGPYAACFKAYFVISSVSRMYPSPHTVNKSGPYQCSHKQRVGGGREHTKKLRNKLRDPAL